MSRRSTVAIVGAGFSGLLTALHLAADPGGPQVRLIERAGRFGRGAAYSTANPDHLLNVRVDNMSAYPDQPDHFIKWLSLRGGWSAHGGFVTRGVYGDYLQDLLRQALETFGADRLLLEQDEVVDLVPHDGAWRAHLALGRALEADAVVLAPGVLAPEPPAGADPALLISPRYLANPWLETELPEGDLLLLGTGLTMVDAALTHARPGGRTWAISRRGLLPRTHAPVAARPPAALSQGSPLAMLRDLRAAADLHGWREAVDDLRPHVREIWRAWSQPERAAFLRHLRPWWDVHRHRLAPSAARHLSTLMRGRDLTLRAGEVVALTPHDRGVEVVWRPRGGEALRRMSVGAVINCMGLPGDITRSADPLLGRLLTRGLIRPDPNRLGAEVDDVSRLVGRDGVAWTSLHAVGSITRGAVWEMTSVPDIRGQAAATAASLLTSLPSWSSAA